MARFDGDLTPAMPRLTPRRIAAVYVLFGLAWIFFSDSLLWLVTADAEIRLRVEALKGALFVVVSAGLIYWLSARAHRAKERAHERLHHQNRELSIFHRIVRHNLRNITTVITGRVEAASEEMAGPNPHLAVIERKSDRLRTLAEKASLLRGVSDEQSARRVRQDLCRAVTDICKQYRSKYPEATVTVDCPTCVETMIPARTGFAVSELVENAIVHGGPQPEVTVSVVADDEIRITVADDGPGLPDVERTAIEGNVEDVLDHSEGVGLWLVRLIVENAGGRLAVRNTDDSGTSVMLAFPRVDSEQTEKSPEHVEPNYTASSA